MRISDEEYEYIRACLPYWIYRYADGSEAVVNREYDCIWIRTRIGNSASRPAFREHPGGFIDSRRFYGENPNHSPFQDRAALVRLRRSLDNFVAGKDVWEDALFDAGYEPVRALRWR